MQRLVIACSAAIGLVAAPALADKLPLPKASYSADVVFTAKGKSEPGKIFVDGPKERRELTTVTGLKTVIIIRRDKGKVYDLKPKSHLAVAMRIAAAEAAGKTGAPGTDIDSFYGADVESQGLETIDGLLTTKYAIRIDGGPDLTVDATVWATDDGIIVRVVGRTSIDSDNTPARMELKNIVRGPQDAALFEIPAGMDMLSAGGEGDVPEKGTTSDGTQPPAPAPDASQAPAPAVPAPAAPAPAPSPAAAAPAAAPAPAASPAPVAPAGK
jgi:hypothetical protein